MFVAASAWKNSVNAVIGGVEMLLSPLVLKSLNSIERIQSRIIVARFNGNPGTTVISSNSPTNASDEAELDTFYNELSSFVQTVSKHI